MLSIPFGIALVVLVNVLCYITGGKCNAEKLKNITEVRRRQRKARRLLGMNDSDVPTYEEDKDKIFPDA